MKRQFSTLIGVILVVLGVQALFFNVVMPVFGFEAWSVWRLWPVVLISTGLLFVIPAATAKSGSGLALLFIPALPILATGLISLWASVFNWWDVWNWAWPVEVLVIGLAFLLAGIKMRVIGLTVPASIFWFTGLALQFCALTNLWHWWAVLWTVVPFSVGLSLLLIGLRTHSTGTLVAGEVISGMSGLAAAGMLLLMAGFWTNVFGSVMIIVTGVIMLVWNLLQYRRPVLTTE